MRRWSVPQSGKILGIPYSTGAEVFNYADSQGAIRSRYEETRSIAGLDATLIIICYWIVAGYWIVDPC